MEQVEELKLKAKKISLGYVALASLYILFSDLLIGSLSFGLQSSVYIQIVKGLLFVSLTGFLLYVLLSRYFTKLEEKQDELLQSKSKVNEQRQLFRAIINQTEAVIYVKDSESRVLMVNDAFLKLFGLEREEIVGRKEKILYDEDLLEQIKRNDQEVWRSGKPKEFEEEIKVNGETRYFQTIKYPLVGVPNYEGCICGISTDITEKRRTMDELRERTKEQACLYKISDLSEKEHSVEELLDRAVNYMPEGWQYPDITEAKITFAGKEFKTSGFWPSEKRLVTINDDIEGKPLRVEVVYVDNRQSVEDIYFLDEERELIEAIADTLTTKIDRVLTISELQSSLREKKVLLQEIHHRVKNNLAVVSGLLQLQRFKLDDDYYDEILQSSEMRIQTMGLVHDKLYQSDSLSSIDVGNYIEDLVATLKNALSLEEKIKIKLSIDSIQLNINQAIPSALILNELVTNAVKHAFPDGKGNIKVSIHEYEDDRVTVSVADDGVGIPEDVDIKETNSMGYTIINTLIRQLSAELDVNSSRNGTTISYHFTKKSIKGSSSNID